MRFVKKLLKQTSKDDFIREPNVVYCPTCESRNVAVHILDIPEDPKGSDVEFSKKCQDCNHTWGVMIVERPIFCKSNKRV